MWELSHVASFIVHKGKLEDYSQTFIRLEKVRPSSFLFRFQKENEKSEQDEIQVRAIYTQNKETKWDGNQYQSHT